jgi:hypothetical protein
LLSSSLTPRHLLLPFLFCLRLHLVLLLLLMLLLDDMVFSCPWTYLFFAPGTGFLFKSKPSSKRFTSLALMSCVSSRMLTFEEKDLCQLESLPQFEMRSSDGRMN